MSRYTKLKIVIFSIIAVSERIKLINKIESMTINELKCFANNIKTLIGDDEIV